MNIRTSEYDAFGPWIYIIDEEHTLPKLFMPYENYLDGALMKFKIPRGIERRKASPDMDLYNAVVAVFEDYVLMLKRSENGVVISKAEMKDIVAVENSHFLLLGKVTLYMDRDIFQIEYNTVSVEIIEDFINLIRSKLDYKEKPLGLDFLPYDKNTIDFLFAHLVDKFREADETIGLIAYQPKHKLSIKKDFLSRLKDYLSKTQMITCSAFLANDKEMIVINRSSPLKSDSNDDYAYTYIYLPIKNIEDAQIWEKSGEESLFELRFKAADHEFVNCFTDSNQGIKDLKEHLY